MRALPAVPRRRARRARCRCSSSTTRAPHCSPCEPGRKWRAALAPTGRLLRMPELPEAERARTSIERGALRRRIVAVDDADSLRLPPARARRDRRRARRPRAHRRAPARQGDVGRDRRRRARARPAPRDGRAHRDRRGAPRPRRGWDRFVVHFDDGGRMVLRDKRRLGRARLEPDLAALGPDAAEIGARRVPRARRPRQRAAQGADHGPGRVSRRRQPAGRRDPVARAAGPAPPGRRAEHRRSSTCCAARSAPRCARRSAAAASTPAT